jgi:arabinofuranosyltransferase
MNFFWYSPLKLITTALLINVIGAAFTYKILDPKIGIDDANITQTYAKNISNGFGYVYNAGGEHVEGSTSLLWTVFNVFFFNISESPEKLITIFCFFLTTFTIMEMLRFLKECSSILKVNYGQSTIVLGGLLLSYPSFFGWSIWSLMDTTLWILIYTIVACRSLNIVFASLSSSPILPRSNFLIYACLIIFPLVRPEGIVVSLGFSGFLTFHAYANNLKILRTKLLIIISFTIAIFLSITIFRLHYFGFPFPNTFYAKVSTNYIEQIFNGLIYLIRYLQNPSIVLITIYTFCGLMIIYLQDILPLKTLRWLLSLFVSAVIGIFSMYVVLGGDHFNSARQFQVLTPMLVVFATLGLLLIANINWYQLSVQKTKNRKFLVLLTMIFIASTVTLPSLAIFHKDGGGLTHEFRLAERERVLGEILNQLPDSPSIGVLAAGGISRTYKGHIYDMLGLNWVEMAHANRHHTKKGLKNHLAFNKEVFFRNLPDLFIPVSGPCIKNHIMPFKDFLNITTDGVINDERFVKVYTIACYRGAIFYLKRSLFDKWEGLLTTPS